MKGIRFYLDYPSRAEKNKGTRKDPGNHHGNVIAVFPDNGNHLDRVGLVYGCVSALLHEPNSVVCSSSVPTTYLEERCKRISEQQAREIHPKLFVYLDD